MNKKAFFFRVFFLSNFFISAQSSAPSSPISAQELAQQRYGIRGQNCLPDQNFSPPSAFSDSWGQLSHPSNSPVDRSMNASSNISVGNFVRLSPIVQGLPTVDHQEDNLYGTNPENIHHQTETRIEERQLSDWFFLEIICCPCCILELVGCKKHDCCSSCCYCCSQECREMCFSFCCM